jgi:hypothetical protein
VFTTSKGEILGLDREALKIAANWNLEIGNWKLEIGNWKLDFL